MKNKKRVLSLILLFSMFVSGFGISNVSNAEEEIVPAPEQETTVISEQISTKEGEKVFEDYISENDKNAPLKEESQETVEETEVKEIEKSEEMTNDDNKKEKPSVTDVGTEDVAENFEDDEKTETVETKEPKVGGKRSFEHTDTIVKDEEKGIWRKIKDGDFFVEIQEAIKDDAGNILGWLEGLFGDTTLVGPSYIDPITGERVQEKETEIKDGFFPIEAEADGSGKWKAEITPDADGTSYFKVIESKKYQEREILHEIKDDDGNVIGYEEGDLIYLDADGNPTKEATRMEHEDPDDPDSPEIEVQNSPKMSDKKLPGVTYDETIYYLKYEDGELKEVKVVIPGVDNDPFKNLDSYSKKEFEDEGNGTMPRGDNPIDKFVEYLNGENVSGVNESEFSNTGKKYEKDKALSFNNEFELPDKEVEVEGSKDLIGKDLIGGDFEFVITDKNGNEIGSGKNDIDGNFTINIPVDHEGEFEYYLTEKNGGDSTIIYDGKEYKVLVKVKFDRLTNTFTSELVYMDKDGNILEPEKVKFENEYKPPTTPTTPTEPTIPTEPTEPTTPSEPTIPIEPTKPTKPTIPTESTEITVPTKPVNKGKKLPKTGMVSTIGLSIAGIGLVVGGIYQIKNKKED